MRRYSLENEVRYVDKTSPWRCRLTSHLKSRRVDQSHFPSRKQFPLEHQALFSILSDLLFDPR